MQIVEYLSRIARRFLGCAGSIDSATSVKFAQKAFCLLRGREGEREGGGERERERERGCVCVCGGGGAKQVTFHTSSHTLAVTNC